MFEKDQIHYEMLHSKQMIVKRKRNWAHGFPSLVAVDKDIALGSRKLAATASSNHLRNCKITTGSLQLETMKLTKDYFWIKKSCNFIIEDVCQYKQQQKRELSLSDKNLVFTWRIGSASTVSSRNSGEI